MDINVEALVNLIRMDMVNFFATIMSGEAAERISYDNLEVKSTQHTNQGHSQAIPHSQTPHSHSPGHTQHTNNPNSHSQTVHTDNPHSNHGQHTNNPNSHSQSRHTNGPHSNHNNHSNYPHGNHSNARHTNGPHSNTVQHSNRHTQGPSHYNYPGSHTQFHENAYIHRQNTHNQGHHNRHVNNPGHHHGTAHTHQHTEHSQHSNNPNSHSQSVHTNSPHSNSGSHYNNPNSHSQSVHTNSPHSNHSQHSNNPNSHSQAVHTNLPHTNAHQNAPHSQSPHTDIPGGHSNSHVDFRNNPVRLEIQVSTHQRVNINPGNNSLVPVEYSGMLVVVDMIDIEVDNTANWQKGYIRMETLRGNLIAEREIIWPNGKTITRSQGEKTTGFVLFQKDLLPENGEVRVTARVRDYLDEECTEPAGDWVYRTSIVDVSLGVLRINIRK